MTAATAVAQQAKETVAARRGRVLGVLYILIGIAILLLFPRGLEGDLQTTFGMNPGRRTEAIRIPDLVFPTRNALYLLSALSVILGVWQLSRPRRPANWMLGVTSLFFVLSFHN